MTVTCVPASSSGFVAVAVRSGAGVSAYGPFGSRRDAIMAGDWIGAADPAVRVTREMALHPPDDHPLVRRTRPPVGDVVEVPDEFADDLRTPDYSASHGGEVVVLALVEGASRYAVLIGPMDPVAAEQWVVADDPLAECRILPLRRTGIAVDGLLDTTTTSDSGSSRPAVVLLETDDAEVVFGPFATGMAAALYGQMVRDTRILARVRSCSVCELAPPADDSDDDPATGCRWVVRLIDTHSAEDAGEPVLVGPFVSQRAARAWPTGGRRVSVLPIRQP